MTISNNDNSHNHDNSNSQETARAKAKKATTTTIPLASPETEEQQAPKKSLKRKKKKKKKKGDKKTKAKSKTTKKKQDKSEIGTKPQKATLPVESSSRENEAEETEKESPSVPTTSANNRVRLYASILIGVALSVVLAVALGVVLGTKNRNNNKNNLHCTGTEESFEPATDAFFPDPNTFISCKNDPSCNVVQIPSAPTPSPTFSPTISPTFAPTPAETFPPHSSIPLTEAQSGYYLSTIALSLDGKRAVVGNRWNSTVRVFEWTGEDWEAHEPIRSSTNNGVGFGFGVRVSSDGNRVLASDGSSYAQVWEYDRDKRWVQVGQDITGALRAVDLSSDGKRVAFMTETSIRVFGWEEACGWNRLGKALEGATYGEIALSADGTRLTVDRANLSYDETWRQTGQVLVYEWTGDEWLQVSPVVIKYFGGRARFSGDGTRIAITKDDGSTSTFRFDEEWVSTGDIDIGDPYVMAMSSNGERITIVNHDNGTSIVLVFDWDGAEWIQLDPVWQSSDYDFEEVALSPTGKLVAAASYTTDRVDMVVLP